MGDPVSSPVIYLIEHFIRFYRPRWRVICIFLLFYSLIYTKYVNSFWCIEIKFHVNLVFVSRIHNVYLSLYRFKSWQNPPEFMISEAWRMSLVLLTPGSMATIFGRCRWWYRDNSDYICILQYITGARNPRHPGSEGADVHWWVEEGYGGPAGPQGDDLLPQVQIVNVKLIMMMGDLEYEIIWLFAKRFPSRKIAQVGSRYLRALYGMLMLNVFSCTFTVNWLVLFPRQFVAKNQHLILVI